MIFIIGNHLLQTPWSPDEADGRNRVLTASVQAISISRKLWLLISLRRSNDERNMERNMWKFIVGFISDRLRLTARADARFTLRMSKFSFA